MSDAAELRAHLAALADSIADTTGKDRAASDTAQVLSIAGLIRWSGAPKNSGWTPTRQGRRIINHFSKETRT